MVENENVGAGKEAIGGDIPAPETSPAPSPIHALPGWEEPRPAWEQLSPREQDFVRAYIQTNGDLAQAAIRAGYHTSPRTSSLTPHFVGRSLMKLYYVKQAVKEYWDSMHMSPEEVIARLAQQARNDVMGYVTHDEEGVPRLDTQRMIADGKGHLIKGIKLDQKGQVVIETFDAQQALVHVGRSMQMFGDRNQNDVSIGVKRLIGVSEEEL